MVHSLAWLNRAVIYHIFLDRFAGVDPALEGRWDEPIFLGGNLSALEDRLPYLQELGVDIVWLSPFFKTEAFHGYHITDFKAVDPRFGTMEDFESLLTAIKRAGMRIMIDFVPNHCSDQHPIFQAALKGDKELRKWFYFNAKGEYLGYQGYGFLPKVNLDYPAAREYFIEAARFWVEKGVDALRLDYAIGPSFEFWAAFRDALKPDFPDVLLLGEVWLDKVLNRDLGQVHIRNKWLRWLKGTIHRDDLQRDHIGLLDGVLDFCFHQIMLEKAAHADLDREELQKELTRHYGRYPDGYVLPSFLDNHDVNRFLFEAGQDEQKLFKAFEVQMAQDQPAVIYYGTELGLSQTQSVWRNVPFADIEARRPMPWALTDNPPPIWQHIQRLISTRKSKF